MIGTEINEILLFIAPYATLVITGLGIIISVIKSIKTFMKTVKANSDMTIAEMKDEIIKIEKEHTVEIKKLRQEVAQLRAEKKKGE